MKITKWNLSARFSMHTHNSWGNFHHIHLVLTYLSVDFFLWQRKKDRLIRQMNESTISMLRAQCSMPRLVVRAVSKVQSLMAGFFLLSQKVVVVVAFFFFSEFLLWFSIECSYCWTNYVNMTRRFSVDCCSSGVFIMHVFMPLNTVYLWHYL